MKIKSIVMAGAAAMAISASVNAAPTKVGLYIGSEAAIKGNIQEEYAKEWFEKTFGNQGVVLTVNDLEAINADEIEAICVIVDRVGGGLGFNNLPDEFNNDDFVDALAGYVEDGGNLYLLKAATALLQGIGRMPANYMPGICGDGAGGEGDDVWGINAHIGSWQFNPGNTDQDPTQIYDHRGHDIYKGLVSLPAGTGANNYVHDVYPMMYNDGNPYHRCDRNYCWDLNSNMYDYTNLNGKKNTIEVFEAKHNCTVLGTWTHVQDYCVPTVVEFAPVGAIKGRIITNSGSTYQLKSEDGKNIYQANAENLSKNVMTYLAPSVAAVEGIAIDVAVEGEAVYYNLQGVQVANPANGLYIKVNGNKATKVLVK